MELPVISRTSHLPVYRQICLYYQTAITNGTLPPGSKLPTERDLAKMLGVNRSTVSTAYAELRSTGLIQTTPGSGTAVAENLWGVTPRLNWNRFVNPSFSPTLPVVSKIREASSAPGMIDLASGQLGPSLVPQQTLEYLLGEIRLNHQLDYPDPKGLPSLRNTMAAHLRRQYGVHCGMDEIMITSGAQLAFMLLTECILSAGDSVVIECPSYTYTLKFFAAAGIRMLKLPIDENGLNPMDVQQLYERHRIRAVFTNPTYQNPTGTTLSLERRRSLLEICHRLQIPIVEIDFFNALTFPNSPSPPPSLKALDDNGLVIQVGSFSDTIAPGIRMGWIAGSRSLVDRLQDVKNQMDLGSSVIPQLLTDRYLSDGHWERHVVQLRKDLHLRRNHLAECLAHYTGGSISAFNPNGGLDLWCRLSAPIPDLPLVEQAIRHGVLVSPGSIYGADPGHLRLSFAKCTMDEIEEGVRRLADCLKSLKEQSFK